jgi:hypothetical protein
MNKSLTSLLILLTLSACNFIEPYYVRSEDSIKKVENQNLKKLLSADKFYLKFQYQPKFGFKLLVTTEFPSSKVKDWDSEDVETLSMPNIRNLFACDYFDEKNWNCGDDDTNKKLFIMKNGVLYNGSSKLEKRYKFNW